MTRNELRNVNKGESGHSFHRFAAELFSLGGRERGSMVALQICSFMLRTHYLNSEKIKFEALDNYDLFSILKNFSYLVGIVPSLRISMKFIS